MEEKIKTNTIIRNLDDPFPDAESVGAVLPKRYSTNRFRHKIGRVVCPADLDDANDRLVDVVLDEKPPAMNVTRACSRGAVLRNEPRRPAIDQDRHDAVVPNLHFLEHIYECQNIADSSAQTVQLRLCR